MDPVLKDKRFAHVAKDPRFRKMPKGERKVKIDQRFKHMFKDKKFKMKYSVDKRGRPVNLTTNENLKKYYELSDRETSDDEETGKDKAQKIKKSTADRKHKKGKILTKGKNAAPSKARDVVNDSDESTSEESDADQALSVHDSGVDFARGESFVYSSSSEDSSDAEEDENDKNDSEFDHRWGETDENVEEVQDATHRLAVCNMDWDRMKARDIYVLLNSLKPSSGLIKSVKIYPSEFGKERMAEEEKQGPRELTQVKLEEGEANDDKDAEDNDGTQYHMEKLREYQLKRLRYFYAVVECDSVTTADEIYKECDGLEYESSCTKLDLRFIPEDMEFDESEVKSSCTEAPVGYKPQFFSNAALSQSKVDLTWDETDRDRVQLTIQQFSKKADEIEDNDLKAYLASSSDEEDMDNCITNKGVWIMKTMIAICFMAIISSLSGFILDLFVPKNRPCRLLQRNAIPSILTVILSVTINLFCYWVTTEVEDLQKRTKLHPGSRVLVDFDISFYLITAAGGLSVLATACNCLRRQPVFDDSGQGEQLLDDYDGLDPVMPPGVPDMSHLISNHPAPPPYTP